MPQILKYWVRLGWWKGSELVLWVQQTTVSLRWCYVFEAYGSLTHSSGAGDCPLNPRYWLRCRGDPKWTWVMVQEVLLLTLQESSPRTSNGGGGGRRQVDGDIHFVMFPMTYLNGVKTATDLHIQFFSPLLWVFGVGTVLGSKSNCALSHFCGKSGKENG